MTMSPLTKYRASIAAFIACGFFFGLLTIYVHDAFVFLFFANVLAWGWLIRKVRCNHCGQGLAPPAGFSIFAVWRSYTEKRCANCGHDL